MNKFFKLRSSESLLRKLKLEIIWESEKLFESLKSRSTNSQQPPTVIKFPSIMLLKWHHLIVNYFVIPPFCCSWTPCTWIGRCCRHVRCSWRSSSRCCRGTHKRFCKLDAASVQPRLNRPTNFETFSVERKYFKEEKFKKIENTSTAILSLQLSFFACAFSDRCVRRRPIFRW